MAEVDIPISPESEFFKNIAKDLSDADLDRIGEEVVAGYENDKDSLSELEDLRIEYNAIFDLKHVSKNHPWPNASNIKLPAMTTACINFQARASINLLPPRNIVKGFPVDRDIESEFRAKRIAQHMNWQLTFSMPNFRSSWDKTLMMLPKDGHAFRKVFWDPIQEKVISDYILPEDFVVNYYTKDLETSQRYTQVMHMTVNELKIREEQGIYINTDELEIPLRTKTDNLTIRNKQNVGESEPEPDYATPMDVLEQHTYIKLNEDDDIRTPYVVTVNRETKKVHRIVNRSNPLTNRPICYYTAYEFIPNPESIYGYGFGLLLLGANHAMNTAINQLMDASHLQVVTGGWVLEGSHINRGDLSFEMGEFKSVKARVDDIRKAVFPLEFKPPSPVLMDLVNFLQNYVNNLTTVTELFTGAVPRSDTTATASTLAVEQGAKVFTGIQQRIHNSFAKELQKIADLNGIFLDETEYIDIVTEGLGPDEETQVLITRDDYLSPLDVRPVSDPNIISEQQNIGRAEALAQAVAQNPFLAQNPVALQLVTERRLQALNENPALIQSINTAMQESVQNFKNQSIIQAEQAKQIQQQEEAEQQQQAVQQEQQALQQEEQQLESAMQQMQ